LSAPDLENRAGQGPGGFSPLVVIAGLMIASYLTANVMAVKIVSVAGLSLFDAGTITFPIAYMVGDVLTEIWGFRTARQVIWLTFACNLMLVGATALGALLPSPAYAREMADAYARVFGYVPRIVLASLLGFLGGELSNAFFMDRIKRLTGGRRLWLRTIGSSAVGYLFDTVLFVFAAFYGTVPAADLLSLTAAQYVLKLAVEALGGTPLAYASIRFLQKRYGAR
jgi:uncharacterized integral membrane protein (TIGR00697 family)